MQGKVNFIGYEVEGSNKGELTLFIGNPEITKIEFEKILEHFNGSRLYFGAGNNRGISSKVVPLLHVLLNTYTIVLEIDNLSQISNLDITVLIHKNLTITFVMTNFLAKFISILKLDVREENKIYCYKLKDPITNLLSDPLYNQDKEILLIK